MNSKPELPALPPQHSVLGLAPALPISANVQSLRIDDLEEAADKEELPKPAAL